MWTQGGLAMPTDTKVPTKQKYANETDAMATTNSNFHFSMRDWRGHLHLCSAAQKVFVALCLRSSRKFGAWTCIPGYDLLARDTGLSLRRVEDMIKLLVAKGFILLERRADKFGGDLANRYELPAERMWAEGRKNFLAEKEITDDKRKEKAEKLAAFRGAEAAQFGAAEDVDVEHDEAEKAVLDTLGMPKSSAAKETLVADSSVTTNKSPVVKAAPKVEETIDIATADFLDYADATLLSRRAYFLALVTYRLAGRTTVILTTLKAAAELMEDWVFYDGEDVSDDDFNRQVSRIAWACSVEPKWSEWIAKHKGCPCAYLDKQWGDSKDDNKLGHQSSDRWLAAHQSGKELVPGLVPATEAYPELSTDSEDGDNGITDEDIAA